MLACPLHVDLQLTLPCFSGAEVGRGYARSAPGCAVQDADAESAMPREWQMCSGEEKVETTEPKL